MGVNRTLVFCEFGIIVPKRPCADFNILFEDIIMQLIYNIAYTRRNDTKLKVLLGVKILQSLK